MTGERVDPGPVVTDLAIGEGPVGVVDDNIAVDEPDPGRATASDVHDQQ